MNDSSQLIPGLPDEIAKQCLIRLPRKFHKLFFSVSKGWFFFLQSVEFANMRKVQGLSEKWLYVLSRDKTEKLSWHSFDPRSMTWHSLPPLPPQCERAYGLSCATCCGKLYLIGGAGWFKSSKSDVFSYDPLTDSWSQMSNLNSARCYALSGVINERIYVVGGMGSTTSGLLKTVETYDPKENRWHVAEDLPMELDLEDCVIYNGCMYVRNIKTIHHLQNLDSAYCYDPVSRHWSITQEGMVKEWNGPTTVFNGRLYMILNSISIRLMVFDEASSTWMVVGKLCTNLMPPHRLIAIDGKLFVIGRGGGMIIVDISLLNQHGHVTVARHANGFGLLTDMVFGCYSLEV